MPSEMPKVACYPDLSTASQISIWGDLLDALDDADVDVSVLACHGTMFAFREGGPLARHADKASTHQVSGRHMHGGIVTGKMAKEAEGRAVLTNVLPAIPTFRTACRCERVVGFVTHDQVVDFGDSPSFALGGMMATKLVMKGRRTSEGMRASVQGLARASWLDRFISTTAVVDDWYCGRDPEECEEEPGRLLVFSGGWKLASKVKVLRLLDMYVERGEIGSYSFLGPRTDGLRQADEDDRGNVLLLSDVEEDAWLAQAASAGKFQVWGHPSCWPCAAGLQPVDVDSQVKPLGPWVPLLKPDARRTPDAFVSAVMAGLLR